MKTLKKIQKTLKCVQMYLNSIYKNYKCMKTKLAKIWASIMFLAIVTNICSCNVSRTVTTKAEYLQRGDTTTTIITKTTETYNAEKK